MINIKRFFDKVSLMESKQSKDLVIPITEARMIRDEMAKVLADAYESKKEEKESDEVVKIEIKGGSFK